MRILGINIGGHDHSVFIIDTKKEDIFAISLERVNRIKHDNNSLDLVVKEYPEEFKNIDYVCLGGGESENYLTHNTVGRWYADNLRNSSRFYKRFKPRYKKEQVQLVKDRVSKNPIKFGLKNYILSLKLKLIKRNDFNQEKFTSFIQSMLGLKNKIEYFDHHKCHAASSYYFSGFSKERVLSLTIDGYGDDYHSKVYLCEDGVMSFVGGSKVRKVENSTIGVKLASIGMLYGNFTSTMGLIRDSEEGKVEALAAYGNHDNEIFHDLMKSYEIKDDSLVFNDVFDKYYNSKYLKRIRVENGDENFCAAIQSFLNCIIVDYTKHLKIKYKVDKICLSGGVAANVIMNLAIFEENNFKDVYVFPAMADDGVAAGAAIIKLKQLGEDVSFLNKKIMPYWGPEINYKNNLESTLHLNRDSLNFEIDKNWQKKVAQYLFDNKVGALAIGKMEYGPRALGNRSIIASPLSNITRDKINSYIKKRPSYQPFCPSVLEEERERLFVNALPNKHMTFAFRLRDEFKNSVPSAVHVDSTARPQFVERDDNPKYHGLLKEFKKLSGFGVIIDTSFNLHGRTIVRTPQDAIDDFIDCNLDFLVIGDYLVTRRNCN